MNTFIKYTLLALFAINAAMANNKIVVYWGQNSAGNEGSLRSYCSSSSIDIVVVGFVYEFPTAPGSQYPGLNFANHCYKTLDSTDPYFLDCSDTIGVDVTYCQSLGKQVLLSFGGAVGGYGFSSDSQAETFATTVWNMFLGGTSTTRPFGNAIFDGVDLDIEAGGSRGYAAFINKLRTYYTAQTARTYYISGAPQCVFPDAMMGPGTGTALGSAWFDYVWVQFYNNYCGINYYPSQFNFNVWANWASSSMNPNVQVFIGAPGSRSAAGQGYVSAATLNIIHTAVAATYPTNYGGIMLWDAGSAMTNSDFATQLAAFVHVGGSSPVISTPPTITPTPTTPVTVASLTTASVPATPVKITPLTTLSSVPATPVRVTTTSKVSTPTPKPSPTPIPTPTLPLTTQSKPSTPVPTPSTSTSSTSSSSTCVSGHMKCLADGSYSTCNHGEWGPSQACGTRTSCSQSGDYIYCLLSTTTPSSSSTSAASTGSCTLGYQQCVGASSFQTCGAGRNGGAWAAVQQCPSGLSCHLSATGNNIYCY